MIVCNPSFFFLPVLYSVLVHCTNVWCQYVAFASITLRTVAHDVCEGVLTSRAVEREGVFISTPKGRSVLNSLSMPLDNVAHGCV